MSENKKSATKLCGGHNSPFFLCSGLKSTTKDYFVSWSRFSDGYVPLCKTCLNKLWKYWLEETNEEKTALYYCLSQIDTPFIKEVYEEVIKIKGKITLNSYISELHKRTSNKEIYENFACTDVTDISKLGTKIATLEEQKEENDRLRKIWGIQETSEDYEFLEDTYDRYTKDIEEISVQQQDLYKDLCRDRLLLRKLSENSQQDNDMITKVQTRLNTLMKTLKIDNFETTQKRTLSEQSFIEKIKIMEQTKPMEVYATENVDYNDFTKRKHYYEELVLRPLCNTLAGHKDFNIDMSDLEQYNLKGDK